VACFFSGRSSKNSRSSIVLRFSRISFNYSIPVGWGEMWG
jgi:hypothetical protein